MLLLLFLSFAPVNFSASLQTYGTHGTHEKGLRMDRFLCPDCMYFYLFLLFVFPIEKNIKTIRYNQRGLRDFTGPMEREGL